MKNKISLYTIFICILIFIIFAYAGYHWHFYKEEVSLLFSASRIKSFWDLLTFFLNGNTSGNAHPSNYVKESLTFLNSFYRPLLFVISYIQFKVFGIEAYRYYLTAIEIHLCNAYILFLLLKKYFSLQLCSLLTIFFIFHPAFATWIGYADMQQYLISTLGILLTTLFLNKYFKQKSRITLIGINFIYLATLFTRETIIITPCALILTWIMVKIQNRQQKTSTPFLWPIITAILSSSIYVIAKQIAFPLKISTATSFTNFSAPGSLYILQIIIFMQDILSLSWFPYGKPMLKVAIMGLLTIGLLKLFIKSSSKKEILFLTGLFFLFLWPAILIGYFVPSRYFYEATPFYIFILAYLFKEIQHKKLFILGLFGVFITINMIYTIRTLRHRTVEPTRFYHAINKLKGKTIPIAESPLCFLGLTEELSWTGLAQQLWLHDINHHHPIYIFHQVKIHPQMENPGRYITIALMKNSFVFSSIDSTKCWFSINQDIQPADDPYGDVSINIQKNGKITQVTVTPKDIYFNKKTLFITWNYTNDEFFVFPPAPTNAIAE